MSYEYNFPQVHFDVTVSSQVQKICEEYHEFSHAIYVEQDADHTCEELLDLIHACETLLRYFKSVGVDTLSKYNEVVSKNDSRGYYKL